jgi:uncharacterized cupin superfamily protein
VTVGAGIPIHRHLKMNEAFYVLEGSGIFILNDVRHPFEKGGTIVVDPSVETAQLRDSCGWLLRTGQQQSRERSWERPVKRT